MQDIIFVGITMAFFAVCVAYVRGLDRIVRSAEEPEASHDAPVYEAGSVTVASMTTDNIIGLILGVLLAVYLVLALLFPERF